MSVEETGKGAFVTSLKRNNKQIRDDRAESIAETAEMLYRRKVEDLEVELKQMMRERDNMLDLSPTNAMSLVLASDFDAQGYVEKEIALGVKIRNTEITVGIAKERYSYLFGGM